MDPIYYDITDPIYYEDVLAEFRSSNLLNDVPIDKRKKESSNIQVNDQDNIMKDYFPINGKKYYYNSCDCGRILHTKDKM